jgi:hypothetical protein
VNKRGPGKKQDKSQVGTGTSVAVTDPGSGAFLTLGSRIRCFFDFWIQDPGLVNNQDPDQEQFFGLKFFFDADPGISLTLGPGWKKFGSGINISNPQHKKLVPGTGMVHH